MPRKEKPITTEEMSDAIRAIAEDRGTDDILDIPGVWESVAEYYNNAAIDLVREWRAEEAERVKTERRKR